MPLLVVGSVAIDNVETPQETRENLLGGSATHFSYSASFFTSVRLVGVVGADWPSEHTELLKSRGIDTSGLQTIADGKTFTWSGRYHDNMNDRDMTNAWLTTPTINDQTSHLVISSVCLSAFATKPHNAIAKNDAATNSSGRPKKYSG